MFKSVKEQVQKTFKEMSAQGVLFVTDVDKDLLWETYLNGFRTPEERQHHTCNCCRQFIKNYGRLVTVVNNELKTVWDFVPTDEEYRTSVEAMRLLVSHSHIRDRFFTETIKLGTNSNYDMEKNVTWEHFYCETSSTNVRPKKDLDTLRSECRTTKDVFKRALDEISISSVETVLELIDQNSLYKGKEFESNLRTFLSCQQEYKAMVNKDSYAWYRSSQLSGSVSRIRNSAIGTLLIDVSEGKKSLDDCVTAYERVVAPSNYKRPTALVTKGMVEEAEKAIESLGLSDSLGRRFATPEDISVDNILFVDRNAKKATSVMEQIKEDIQVNPKTFSKTEEIHIDKFISDILPNSKSVEILVENGHLSNLVSLIAPKEPTAPVLFKWSNPFSWSYVNALTDSMKERVKEAGGNVTGVLRFSIQWNEDGHSHCDFDAHAMEPNGTKICYNNYRARETPMSGMLDVDKIRPKDVGVENITWSNINKMAEGVYKFSVHNYDGGRNTGFSAQIEFDGQIFEFSKSGFTTGTTQVAEVTYSKTKGFSIKSLLDNTLSSSGNVISKEKWGISTNKFRKVSMIMNSPNHWTDKVGNRHVFFVLDGAKCDESPRGFFNEFLKEDLDKNRKVLEVLGSKLKVEPSDMQVTGLGFSDTQRNSFICKVEGSFKRTLKVTF